MEINITQTFNAFSVFLQLINNLIFIILCFTFYLICCKMYFTGVRKFYCRFFGGF